MAAVGRPRSELRQAIAKAFEDAACIGQGLTWRDVAQALHAIGLVHVRSRSELVLVRQTVGNMLSAGQLVVCGARKVQGSKRPMCLYTLAGRADQVDQAQALALVLRAWTG